MSPQRMSWVSTVPFFTLAASTPDLVEEPSPVLAWRGFFFFQKNPIPRSLTSGYRVNVLSVLLY